MAADDCRNATPEGLFADLPADAVFLLVQRPLVGASDVTAVLGRHQALFAADLPVVPVQGGGLGVGQIAFLNLLMDAPVLIVR